MINIKKVGVALFCFIVLAKCSEPQEVVNETRDLFGSKNLVNVNSNVISRLLSESKFNAETVKSIGKVTDAVNHYEDITILDENGQLKNLKYKSANKKPSDINANYNGLIGDLGHDDNAHANIVSDDKHDQIEVPVKLSEIDEVKYELSGHRSKFFDEIGCKYILIVYILVT